MRHVLLAAVLGLALSLAACGGGDDEATPAPTGGTTEEPGLLPGQVRITFYGHSMFEIESAGGTVIVTDPNEGIGYRSPAGPVDLLTLSHDHFDHNKVAVAPGARILSGLTDTVDWARIDETVGDVRVRTVPTFHDGSEGAERGKNAMFLFDIDGLSILHAGDLGHAAVSFEAAAELEASFRPDVLLLPVGGHFTIGPEEAGDMIDALRPRIVIPMHYRTDALAGFPDAGLLAPVDDLLAGREDVRREGGSTVVVGPELPEGTEVVVLEFQPG